MCLRMRNAQQLQSGLGNVKNSEDVIQGILVIVIGEINTTYLGLGLLKTTCLTQLAWWMESSSGFEVASRVSSHIPFPLPLLSPSRMPSK